MKDLSILNYRNIFPAEVSRAGHLLLCLLRFSCPFHRNSLRLLLKPVMGDKQAAALLKELVDRGYLSVSATGLGSFYALTAKTVRYLDIEGTGKPYRSQHIADRLLLTYWLQSYIIASALVERATAVCAEIGGFPKTKENRATVLSAMSSALRRHEIPFVDGYNDTLYQSLPQALHIYEMTQRKLSQQAATLNAAYTKASTSTKAASSYQLAWVDVEQTRAALRELLPKAQLLTYTSGLKVLTLDILQQNGIFIEEIGENEISFGLLDNVAYGVSSRRLAKRLDYIITLANTLGLSPSVTLYTLEDNRATLKKRISLLKLPFSLPPLRFCTVPNTVQPRRAFESGKAE